METIKHVIHVTGSIKELEKDVEIKESGLLPTTEKDMSNIFIQAGILSERKTNIVRLEN